MSLEYWRDLFIVKKNWPGITTNGRSYKCTIDINMFEKPAQRTLVPFSSNVQFGISMFGRRLS